MQTDTKQSTGKSPKLVTALLWLALVGLICDSAMLAFGGERYALAILVLGYGAVGWFEFTMARKRDEGAASAIADIMLGAAMLIAVVGPGS